MLVILLGGFFLGRLTEPAQGTPRIEPLESGVPTAVKTEPRPVEVGGEQKTPGHDPASPCQYRNAMTVNEVIEMVKQLHGLFMLNAPLTFVITAPPEVDCAVTLQGDFYALIAAACLWGGGSLCTIEPAPDPRTEIDTGIPSPEYAGVVIHHVPDSPSDVIIMSYARALGRFIVHKSSHIPDGIARLNRTHNPRFFWFQLGPGCPWTDTHICGESGEPKP
jgi:hypothetical protein